MRASLRTKEEIKRIREAGRILAACHREIRKLLAPGISTLEIDAFVESYLKKHKATPEQKGYRGFPYATCASVNDVVCHGFPDSRQLQAGDLVTIDIVVNKDGWLADSGWSYAVGSAGPAGQYLLDKTHEALYAGINKAAAGMRTGDIGHAVQTVVEHAGLGIVAPLVGHGIGRKLHEPPDVPSIGSPRTGTLLRPGMVITIEPVVTLGETGAVFWEEDGWTVRTADGSLGAQFEHTVAILEDGPQILTD
ncbi:type I methionyl aminopeptidase [Paenibacillus sp. YPG26]|uniref:type I methionyl aminopeptidase n=1 Tax=Paenibacillus sp. YPG26 TaxID=2878915 RepID=UPI002040F73C|nr:type I methionyl aminopeptidase [Paenibacillus sp. YPG26]USB34965.1 type I methionyl aminopeptidase [Paenibacillus sp. YPG26]